MSHFLVNELASLVKMKIGEDKVINLMSDLAYYHRNQLKEKAATSAGFFFGELFEQLNQLYINKLALLFGFEDSFRFASCDGVDVELLLKRKSAQEFELYFKFSDLLTCFNSPDYFKSDENDENKIPKMAWLYLNAVSELDYKEPFLHLFNYKMGCNVTPSIKPKSYSPNHSIEFYKSYNYVQQYGSALDCASIFKVGGVSDFNWNSSSIVHYQELFPNDNLDDLMYLLKEFGFPNNEETTQLVNLIKTIEQDDNHVVNQMLQYRNDNLKHRVKYWSRVFEYNNELIETGEFEDYTENIFFEQEDAIVYNEPDLSRVTKMFMDICDVRHKQTGQFMLKLLHMNQNASEVLYDSEFDLPIFSLKMQLWLKNNRLTFTIPFDVFYMYQQNKNNVFSAILHYWKENCEDIFTYPTNVCFIFDFTSTGLQLVDVQTNAQKLSRDVDFLNLDQSEILISNDVLQEIDVEYHSHIIRDAIAAFQYVLGENNVHSFKTPQECITKLEEHGILPLVSHHDNDLIKEITSLFDNYVNSNSDKSLPMNILVNFFEQKVLSIK